MTMRMCLVVACGATLFAGCNSSGTGGASTGGTSGANAGGSTGATGGSTGATGGAGAGTGGSMGATGGASGAAGGMMGATGGAMGTTGGASGSMGAGGSMGPGGAAGTGAGGAASCTPGVEQTIITDCGYPSAGNPLTTIAFSESEVLAAIVPSGSAADGVVRLFYSDEHALTLGVREVVVVQPGGAQPMTTDYPVSPLPSIPGSVEHPQTGTNELVGPQSGLDVSARPMWPALFVTDISKNPSDRSGDWQMGGRPRGPDAVFGTWKAAVRTFDPAATGKMNMVTITPDPDPKLPMMMMMMKGMWNLGPGADPVPTGLMSQGYTAEVRWNINLTPGHSYRLQVMVHDGDQNKTGGDTGEGCVVFCAGGSGPVTTPDAGAPPPPMCPTGTMACGGQGNIDPASCPGNTVCANGCCLPNPLIP